MNSDLLISVTTEDLNIARVECQIATKEIASSEL